MKTLIILSALTLAAPAAAQTSPAANPDAGHAQHQAMQGQHQGKHSMEDMQKHCQDMMKDHSNKGHRAKMSALELDEDFNGNGHQGHNH